MTKLIAKSEGQEKNPLTKLICDILSVYSSYLADDITHNYTLNALHHLDTLVEPFNVDDVYEHMERLKEDFYDELHK